MLHQAFDEAKQFLVDIHKTPEAERTDAMVSLSLPVRIAVNGLMLRMSEDNIKKMEAGTLTLEDLDTILQ